MGGEEEDNRGKGEKDMLEIVASEGNRSRISLVGKLDTNTSGQLEGYFARMGKGDLQDFVLDMSGCEFVSSAGLRVIMTAQKRVSSVGGKITLKDVTPEVMEAFSVVGFDRVLTIE